MKICNKCKKEKEESEFNLRDSRTGRRRSDCKVCFSVLTRRHYKKNKSIYRKRNRRAKRMDRQEFTEIKKTKSCKKCGESRWWVLDFHHRDPDKKEFGISAIFKSRGMGKKEILMREMEKCDVLCSNCHRDHHYWKKVNQSASE